MVDRQFWEKCFPKVQVMMILQVRNKDLQKFWLKWKVKLLLPGRIKTQVDSAGVLAGVAKRRDARAAARAADEQQPSEGSGCFLSGV